MKKNYFFVLLNTSFAMLQFASVLPRILTLFIGWMLFFALTTLEKKQNLLCENVIPTAKKTKKIGSHPFLIKYAECKKAERKSDMFFAAIALRQGQKARKRCHQKILFSLQSLTFYLALFFLYQQFFPSFGIPYEIDFCIFLFLALEGIVGLLTLYELQKPLLSFFTVETYAWFFFFSQHDLPYNCLEWMIQIVSWSKKDNKKMMFLLQQAKDLQEKDQSFAIDFLTRCLSENKVKKIETMLFLLSECDKFL